jgi:hypothetical protein
VGAGFALKGFLDPLHGGGGVVAIFTEVAEDDLMKLGMGKVGDEGGDLLIGEMPMTGADALLDGPGALGIGIEEVVVVVGLDEEGVHFLETITDEVGDEADVTEHA